MTADAFALEAIAEILNATEAGRPISLAPSDDLANIVRRVADRVRATGREVWGIAAETEISPQWEDEEHLLFAGALNTLIQMNEDRLGAILRTATAASLMHDGGFVPTIEIGTDEWGIRYRLVIEAVR